MEGGRKDEGESWADAESHASLSRESGKMVGGDKAPIMMQTWKSHMTSKVVFYTRNLKPRDYLLFCYVLVVVR